VTTRVITYPLKSCCKGRITARTLLIELCLFDRLHSASVFKIVEIEIYLMEAEGCDIDQRDSMGNTPLRLAACDGHEEAVEMLLGQDDTKVDEPNEEGQTPLVSC